jgi:hypothetical protein
VHSQGFHALDFPIVPSHLREPVPDLNRLPERRWREVLTRVSPGTRRAAMAAVAGDRVERARELVGWLDIEAPHARWSPPVPPRAPVARARSGPRKNDSPWRQLNVRLREDDHRVLVRAAAVLGLRPTALARMLVIQGATRMLIEEDAARRRLAEGAGV